MISKRKKPTIPISLFAEGTARGIREEIAAVDLMIVGAAHDPQRRGELFAAKAHLERRLEQLKHLKGD